MMYIMILVPTVLAALLAMYIIPRILVVSFKRDLMQPKEQLDRDNRRVPRLGGVSLFPVLIISVGVALVMMMMLDKDLLLFGENESDYVHYMMALAGLTAMYLLGVMDDIIGVSVTSKLLMEIAAASLIPLSGLWIDDLHGLMGFWDLPCVAGMLLTVFIVVYITNVIPMMDDVDGLASGMAVIAFSALGWLSWEGGRFVLLIVCVTMAGMLLPFFFRNVFGWAIHWRNIYLGSTGGLTIGYMISFVSIALSKMGGGTLPEGALMVCFGTLIIPMLDVFRVVVMRLVNNRNVLMGGDKNHIHHRLLQGGMKPMRVLFVILGICLFFICFNAYGVWNRWNLSLLLLLDVAIWLAMQIVISNYKNKTRDKLLLRDDGK